MPRRTVDIKPGISVLAVLRHLNYKPWYALAELVDNSIQSFLSHRALLESAHPEETSALRVEIKIDSSALPHRIIVRDNAAGIPESEYGRAFRPAAVPQDRSGLAEFGMGMKSAACWFAPRWSVRTSALGEQLVRTVYFDIDNIVNDQIEELVIDEVSDSPDSHYTEIILESPFHMPVGRTKGKLREHLTDIYRDFLRKKTLDLRLDGSSLAYQQPRILNAPYFKTPTEPGIEWKKQISFDFGNGLSVHGFAAILETGSTRKAGFSLFRRGRVIQGSGDDGYRPRQVFGGPNRFTYQRLFGELHLDGFDVSHTKDGFRWDENEEPFLDLLREYLDSEDMPLLKQSDGYRAHVSSHQLRSVAQRVVKTTTTLMKQRLPEVLPSIADAPTVGTASEPRQDTPVVADRTFEIRFRNSNWSITVQLSNDPNALEWLYVSDSDAASVRSDPRKLSIQVSLGHPFMVRFVQSDPNDLEALLRVAAALAVAEVLARDSGVRQVGTVRRNINDLLREAFSDP